MCKLTVLGDRNCVSEKVMNFVISGIWLSVSFNPKVFVLTIKEIILGTHLCISKALALLYTGMNLNVFIKLDYL